MDATCPTDTSLRPADVAPQLGIKVATLKNWRYTGKGPPYTKASSRVVYKRSDVDAYVAKHRIDPEARRK